MTPLQLSHSQECNGAIEGVDDNIWYYASIGTKGHINKCLEIQNTVVPSELLLASHDTEVNTGTSIGITII